MKRMPMRRFLRLVRDALADLPADFAPYMANVVIDVADRPTADQLRDAGLTDAEIAAGASILGLFDANPLDLPAFAGDSVDLADSPHRIWVFKGPHEEDFRGPAELARQVRKTVIHEVAHHFGLTDDDLERWTSVF